MLKMKYLSLFLLIAMVLTIGTAAIAQDGGEDAPTIPPFFDGERAYTHLESVMQFGPHPTGSEEIVLVGDLIIEHLEATGWEVVTQEFVHDAVGVPFPVRNIIAKRGEGPITMLASHYDSRLWADNDPDPHKRQNLIPGANDGGSSTSVLMEYADMLNQYYDFNEQVWLVFFDAEDNGRIPGWDWIIGSRYMAENLNELGVTPEDFRLMILFDMVGEMDADDFEAPGIPATAGQQEFPIESYSLQSAPEHVEAIWLAAYQLGYGDIFPYRERGSITDDHLPFIEQGIPAVDIIDLNYPYWHTIEDTIDKVSPLSLERVGQVVEIYLLQLNVIQQVETEE